MHIQRNIQTFIGQVFGKRSFFLCSEAGQLSTDCDFGSLLPIRLDMKIFDLQPHEFHVAGQ